MHALPSPPLSPVTVHDDWEHDTWADQNAQDNDTLGYNVMCGSCNTGLGPDWFCPNCHKKCSTCNRFLCIDQDVCSRCWTFSATHNMYIRTRPRLHDYPTALLCPVYPHTAYTTSHTRPAFISSPAPTPMPAPSQHRR